MRACVSLFMRRQAALCCLRPSAGGGGVRSGAWLFSQLLLLRTHQEAAEGRKGKISNSSAPPSSRSALCTLHSGLSALTGDQHCGDALRCLQEVHIASLEGLAVVGLQMAAAKPRQVNFNFSTRKSKGSFHFISVSILKRPDAPLSTLTLTSSTRGCAPRIRRE